MLCWVVKPSAVYCLRDKGVILVNESNFPNVRSSLARQNKDNLLRAYSNRKYSLLQHYRRVALRKP